MFKTVRAVKFLFVGPLILAMLFVINPMTSPGQWWVQWAALGIGIAWVVKPVPGHRSDHRSWRVGRSDRLPAQGLA